MSKEELVSKLREKVHQNQGEIGLCWRNFSFPGNVPSRPIKVFHYVTGQICGELIKSNGQQSKSLNLGYVGGPRSDNSEESHIFYADYVIPSKGILEKKANGTLFLASPEEWETLRDVGYISFALEELGGAFKNSFQMNRTHLTDFGLCVGENDVRGFCEENRLRFYEEGFELLRDSKKRREFIDGHYTKERENLGENLVRAISGLKDIEHNLRRIEERVLASTCTLVYGQERHEEWSNKEAVGKYWDIKSGAYASLSEVQSLLASAKEKELGRLGEISGEIIGFPGSVEVGMYLDYASTLNDSTGELVKGMNQHLVDEEKKAYT